MNTRSTNMIRFLVAISVLFNAPVAAQQVPIWPIRPDTAHWDRVNCTFGEIHGEGTHIHGAIDIDQDPADSARVVQPGEVIDTYKSNPGFGVVVHHEYPPHSGRFERRTHYLHLTNNIPAIGTILGTGDNIGTMGNHLHFVMEEQINDEWVQLNPLAAIPARL